MTSGPAPMCAECARYKGGARCEAYPDGIPDEIIDTQQWDHRVPKPGDRGLQFVPREGAEPREWWPDEAKGNKEHREMHVNLSQVKVGELLRLYTEVLDELRQRGVTRSTNNPVADYTEHLVSTKLGLTLGSNSAAGFDAVDADDRRYQIKGRRLTPQNQSTELSAIRNLPDRPFDFLIAVVYRSDFTIDYAAQVPYEVVVELATFVQHTNAYRFLMRRNVLTDARVIDITSRLVA
jgi:hypothetical protein